MAKRPRLTEPVDLRDKSRGERLQKVLADAGIASRRACEALIEAGEVEVNGEVVAELPAWVDPAVDRIVVQGRPIAKPTERHTYIMLNKPARTLSTAKDAPGADRRTVVELVDHPLAPRLFPVGRLDYDSVGLILLTNDGELANRLSHPRYGVPKTYRVKIKGQLAEDDVAALEEGVYLANRQAGKTVGAVRTSHVEIEVLRRDRGTTHLEITLREGRNRQVRRMFAAVGLPVLSLERIAIGPLKLKGVRRGLWRELTAPELKALRRAAAAGAKGEGSKPEGGRANQAKDNKRNTNKPARSRPDRRGAMPEKVAPEGGEGPAIRRRTMKNVINRASKGEGRE